MSDKVAVADSDEDAFSALTKTISGDAGRLADVDPRNA